MSGDVKFYVSTTRRNSTINNNNILLAVNCSLYVAVATRYAKLLRT